MQNVKYRHPSHLSRSLPLWTGGHTSHGVLLTPADFPIIFKKGKTASNTNIQNHDFITKRWLVHKFVGKTFSPLLVMEIKSVLLTEDEELVGLGEFKRTGVGKAFTECQDLRRGS